ncbi:MAG: hypothetical protein DRR08_33005 [Candidatus Parabeggiatoa sp. nov. 2]|nr:MAG: hypothetical protein DRR08_33005 [Gammaproteobacteria bacterium]HEC86164.1 hypothetical protein [Thioploca sp.]
MTKTLARGLVIILLIPYSLLLFEFLAKDVTVRNIIKVFASVFGPVPLAIFFAYLFVATGSFVKKRDESTLSVFASFNYLLVTLLATTLFLYFFEAFIYKEFSDSVVPIFLNSLVLVMYIANILLTKSIQVIAILSGISMGISIHVLFIT